MARYLITSALPYINGIKHLGNLVGSMLPADFAARYLRAKGHEVLYICATDEHGTPAELAALAAGQTVEQYCAEQHELQKDVYDRFHLSFDYFGRSSSQQNREITQYFCHRLDEHGYIEERSISQVYSPTDARYLPDRYIVGTCPHCGYEAARGDQCENCTRVLDPTDLKEPRSAVSGATDLEVRETRHLFLRQSALVEKLRPWIETRDQWPVLVKSIAEKWLKEGLHDRCITRDLSWGVPVDKPGFEGKVFYVWFDAPIEYIGATKEWADAAPGETRDWEGWWKDEDITYLQFMAKDNVPFHTVSFPCTIFGADDGWRLVDYIKGVNWLTYYGGKFSTSQRRGIFMDQALEEFPADWYRYWLLANAPEGSDASFSWELFQAQVNKDLADVLGNFVNRTLKFCRARFGDTVPEGGAPGPLEEKYFAELDRLIADYDKACAEWSLRRALASLREIWVLGNTYIDEAAPWTAIKTDRDRAAAALRVAINLIRVYALLAGPVMPDTSRTILRTLHREDEVGSWPGKPAAEELATIGAGHGFDAPPILFKKIEDEDVAVLTARYGGG